MTLQIRDYENIVGEATLRQIEQLGSRLKGSRVVHVNSTKQGGGVAEILHRMVPLMQDLGIDTSWEVVTGPEEFFQATKIIHNSLQGFPDVLTPALQQVYQETNEENAHRLRENLEDADFVIIHDPQPAGLLDLCPNRRGKWIWRCHIDVSTPNRNTWRFIRDRVKGYDASIFSLADFAQPLPHPQYLIPPSIDPLSQKNRDMPEDLVRKTLVEYGIDPERPMALQVSRFDKFKDPLGVIQAFQICAKRQDLQLVLAGGGASDDPEGEMVLREVREAAAALEDVHVLVLPSDAHKIINCLQRGASVILQKSLKEGFGLTVTEAMWKGRPVIGGDVGGIRLQVIDRYNGFRVRTPEGAALRMRYLLQHREKAERMGENARAYARQNFLITGQLRSVLALLEVSRHEEERERLEVFLS